MRLCSRFLAQKVCCEFCVLLLCTISLPALKFFWCRLYMFLRMGSYHWPPYYFFFLPGFIYLKLFRIKTIPWATERSCTNIRTWVWCWGTASGTPVTLALVGKRDGTMGSWSSQASQTHKLQASKRLSLKIMAQSVELR